MISKHELEQAIQECETSPPSYQIIQKLADLYTVYDHLYNNKNTDVSLIQESVIDNYGDSEFFSAICGKNPEKVWIIIDELMSVLSGIIPKLYKGTIEKIIDKS